MTSHKRNLTLIYKNLIVTDLDAFCSIEENLCSAEDSPRISDIPSKEETDENNAGNTLFTMEIKVENDKEFLAKVEKNIS